MKRCSFYIISWLLLSVLSLFLNSCKYEGENRVISDKYGTLSVAPDSTELINQQDSTKEAKMNEAEVQSEKESRTEHRVYYVDYSVSMVSKKEGNDNVRRVDGTYTGKTLLQLVKNGLETSLNKIKGQKVRIEIIPFLDSVLWRTKEGKETLEIKSNEDWNKLHDFISKIDTITRKREFRGTMHYNTHHSIAVEDFLNNRIKDPNEYHIMILLTDGIDEHKFTTNECKSVKSALNVLDRTWLQATKGKYVYGVFVDLKKTLKNNDLTQYFINNNDKGLFYINGWEDLDYSVSLLISPTKPIDFRSESNAYIAFSHSGSVPKIKFKNGYESFSDGIYEYTIEKQPDEKSKFITVRLKSLKDINDRPVLHNARLTFEFEKLSNTTQLIEECDVKLTIEDKKTPNIDFKLPDHTKEPLVSIEEDLQYCKKFLGTIAPEWTDTVTLNLSYEKSDDAKDKKEFNNSKLIFTGLPKYVKIIGSDTISLNQKEGSISVKFIVDPSHKDLDGSPTLKGDIIVECSDLLHVYANNHSINNEKGSRKIGSFEINVEKSFHPLLILLICLLIAFVLFGVFVWIWRTFIHPKFPAKIGLQFVISLIGQGVDVPHVYQDERGVWSNNFLFQYYSSKCINKIILIPENTITINYESMFNGKTIYVSTDFKDWEQNIKRIELKPKRKIFSNWFELKVIFIDNEEKIIEFKELEEDNDISNINVNETNYILRIHAYPSPSLN